ncbi:hypothetical protein JHK82_015653 [Glycine max]|nr:hypothetical protein JHK85_016042 [Glycine max]KAG5046273.1 hypothetical protein JHK86_015679 [Glycine max]KAG5148772.1 hypothetical protein JHK82_015653 [Glycine max]
MKIFILFSITFAYGFLGSVVSNANPLPYEVIFDFGDSIWDTGNAAKYHQQMPNNSPYGFSSNKIETFRACCGKGEPYNLSLQIACGSLAAMVCPNPSKHLNWDGPHFPEATYRPIAKGLLEGPFANPPLKIA